MSGSLANFLEQQFAMDDKVYNFYNIYARNSGFCMRKKE